jgi:hypothetical protein
LKGNATRQFYERLGRRLDDDVAPLDGLRIVQFTPGNMWLVQEVTTRLPGRVDAAGTAFSSTADLERALRRAEAAHGEHEKRTGHRHEAEVPERVRDEDWPVWYVSYMVAEQAGTDLPA